MTDHTYCQRDGLKSSSWIDRVSYGGLTKPTDQVLKWVRDMESVFIQTHGDEFVDRSNIKTRLVYRLQSECPEIPKLIINLYARTRIFIRCKFLNKQKEEKSILQRIEKRRSAATKRKITCESLDDASRAKNKKNEKDCYLEWSLLNKMFITTISHDFFDEI